MLNKPDKPKATRAQQACCTWALLLTASTCLAGLIILTILGSAQDNGCTEFSNTAVSETNDINGTIYVTETTCSALYDQAQNCLSLNTSIMVATCFGFASFLILLCGFAMTSLLGVLANDFSNPCSIRGLFCCFFSCDDDEEHRRIDPAVAHGAYARFQ